jgi:hypothetical protein
LSTNASFFCQRPARRKEIVEAALNIEAVNRYEALLKRSAAVHRRAVECCDAALNERARGVLPAATREEAEALERELAGLNRAAAAVMSRQAAAAVMSRQAAAMRGFDPVARAVREEALSSILYPSTRIRKSHSEVPIDRSIATPKRSSSAGAAKATAAGAAKGTVASLASSW